MKIYPFTILIAIAASYATAQPASSFKYTPKDGEKTVEITNVNYEVTGSGLVIRTTTQSKQVIGDIGMEAKSTTEAWNLGTDLKQKPLYTVTVDGSDSHIVEDEVFTVSRGLEEVQWWSIYKLATGAHLFDTYVPLVIFSINRRQLMWRYVGFEVPPDDTKDARLKDPNVVGVITYASEKKVLREVLVTADDPKLAQQLRSFADETRTLTESGGNSQILRLSFSQNFPAPPATLTVVISIAADDLDLARAQLPPHVHLAAWKR